MIDSLSIGFDPGSWKMVALGDGTEIRLLRTIEKLWEISLVTFPADGEAKIRSVHASVFGLGSPRTSVPDGWIREKRFCWRDYWDDLFSWSRFPLAVGAGWLPRDPSPTSRQP